jgi:predicted permease
LLVASQPRPLGIDLGLDVRVLTVALVASVLSGVMLALAPILASKKIALTNAFESVSTTLVTGRRLNVHDLVVTLQIALALAMLISAALFVQSLQSFQSVKPGFRADNLLLASLDPAAAGYDSGRIEGFWRSTLTRVSRVPGVESASLARTVPLAPGRQRQPWVHPTSGEKLELDTNFIGPQYFRTLDIPVLNGREFDELDGKASRPVVIVNERLARLFWPGQDPVGKGIRLPDAGKPMAEVVAVVRDVKYRDLRAETGPMVYRPIFQTRSTDSMSLHVRTSNDPGTVIGAIRGELQNLDRRVPLFQVTTLEEHLNGSFAATRQAAVLTGVFGVFALLLSGIGVYGVTALAVSRRTRDIGIRMALGARRRDIVRAVGGQGAAMIVAGLMLGALASFGFTRFTGTLLFGVTAADAGTFAGMAALLGIVSLIAFCVPVRAATRVDAVAAIRHE